MRFAILSATVLALSACQAGTQQGEADLILTNANVVTVDADRPRAEALAIAGDLIIEVGSAADVERHRGSQTEVIDLEGATVIPGLIDAHIHFPQLGPRTRQLFLDTATGPDEVIAVVSEQVERTAPGEWITGHGWHTVYWEQQQYPDNAQLSRISPENPVFLVGMAQHAAWVNDLALDAAGITAQTPDPPGGQILKDPRTGEPTGILLETAVDLVQSELPPETRESRKADILLSIQTALAFGLTGVHDAGVEPEFVDIYREILDEGALDLRLYVMLFAPDTETLARHLANPPLIALGDRRLTVRAIKAVADGALGARGAALLEPYDDSPGERGLIPHTDEEIYQLVYKSMEAGYQIAVHAIGDRGNRTFLDAVERAQAELPPGDYRARNEHAQVIAPEDIPRFAELGVIASMQPIHCTMDMGFAEARLGPERTAGAYAWKSLLESGARVAAGADTPAFPLHYTNPLWGIHAAVTRQDKDGNPPGGWYPEQRVSRMEALKMYTIHAAYAAFEEQVKGTLTSGKLADITVLSDDILTIPESEILDTEVLMTIVGGEIVYKHELPGR